MAPDAGHRPHRLAQPAADQAPGAAPVGRRGRPPRRARRPDGLRDRVAALGDDAHVDEQRARYRRRLDAGVALLAALGVEAILPDGAFYLWVADPDRDGWRLARTLAERAGVLASPGEFYGAAGAGHVRLAMVQPDDRLALALDRARR